MAIPQYNTIRYDTAQYDASTTFWSQSLSESLSESDIRVAGEDPVKTETLTGVDALLKLVQQAAHTESISSADARTLQDFIVKLDSLSETDAMTRFVNAARNESLSPADSIAKLIEPLRLDADVLMDAAFKFALNGRFETIPVNEPAPQSPARYNTFVYNSRQYNQREVISFAKLIQPSKSEALALTDSFFRVATFVRLYGETLTLSDIRSIFVVLTNVDALVLTDVLTRQVTNKGLSATIKVKDWFGGQRKPAANVWGPEDF